MNRRSTILSPQKQQVTDTSIAAAESSTNSETTAITTNPNSQTFKICKECNKWHNSHK